MGICASYGVGGDVCVAVGKSRCALRFDHGVGRFGGADEPPFARDEREDEGQWLRRGQLVGRGEFERGRFEGGVVVELCFRFANGRPHVEDYGR